MFLCKNLSSRLLNSTHIKDAKALSNLVSGLVGAERELEDYTNIGKFEGPLSGGYGADEKSWKQMKIPTRYGVEIYSLMELTKKFNSDSKVIDVIRELSEFGIDVDTYDPRADKQEVKAEYGVDLVETLNGPYSTIVLAVAHDEFRSLNVSELKNSSGIVYDIKSFYNKEDIDKFMDGLNPTIREMYGIYEI